MEHVDAKTLTDDRWGYSVYTCIVMAPEETARRIQLVRDAVKVTRSMIPAHVTVRGGFGRIGSLDAVKSAIHSVCRDHSQVVIETDHIEHWGTTSVIKCRVSHELRRLHLSLMDALEPLSVDAYHGPERRFSPHLTVFSDPAADLQWARTRAESLTVESPFTCRELQLWGHSGVAYTGRWDHLESFPLGAG